MWTYDLHVPHTDRYRYTQPIIEIVSGKCGHPRKNGNFDRSSY